MGLIEELGTLALRQEAFKASKVRTTQIWPESIHIFANWAMYNGSGDIFFESTANPANLNRVNPKAKFLSTEMYPYPFIEKTGSSHITISPTFISIPGTSTPEGQQARNTGVLKINGIYCFAIECVLNLEINFESELIGGDRQSVDSERELVYQGYCGVTMAYNKNVAISGIWEANMWPILTYYTNDPKNPTEISDIFLQVQLLSYKYEDNKYTLRMVLKNLKDVLGITVYEYTYTDVTPELFEQPQGEGGISGIADPSKNASESQNVYAVKDLQVIMPDEEAEENIDRNDRVIYN